MDPKDFTTTIDYNKTMNEETVSAPVAKGTDLGKVTATIPADTLGYMDGSKEVPTTELITTKAVEKANIFCYRLAISCQFLYKSLLIKINFQCLALPVRPVITKTLEVFVKRVTLLWLQQAQSVQ